MMQIYKYCQFTKYFYKQKCIIHNPSLPPPDGNYELCIMNYALKNSYCTPFIIFFSNGQSANSTTDATPAIIANSIKNSVRLVIWKPRNDFA